MRIALLVYSGGHTDNRPFLTLLPTIIGLRDEVQAKYHFSPALRVGAGASEYTRKLLSTVEMADVTMAPAADMFEMGVKLQVLKRGSMFAMRALQSVIQTCLHVQ